VKKLVRKITLAYFSAVPVGAKRVRLVVTHKNNSLSQGLMLERFPLTNIKLGLKILPVIILSAYFAVAKLSLPEWSTQGCS
jgi:hypothetical protein